MFNRLDCGGSPGHRALQTANASARISIATFTQTGAVSYIFNTFMLKHSIYTHHTSHLPFVHSGGDLQKLLRRDL